VKRESYYAKGNRTGNLLHIETDGCIVNIHVGLIDHDGHQVTRVDVIPDDERRSPDENGQYWHTEDVDGRQLDGVVARVVRQSRSQFSVGETVVIRDTSNDLDAIGDVTAIDGKYANVDIDGALHRVLQSSIRPL
jgi:hypothetical protein